MKLLKLPPPLWNRTANPTLSCQLTLLLVMHLVLSIPLSEFVIRGAGSYADWPI